MKIFSRIMSLFGYGLRSAKQQGMNVESGVTVMKGVNFGSEPYLITLKKNCRISFDVVFLTHDGGTHAFRHLKEYENVIKFGKITVGEGAFVGARAVIMPGVNIGAHAVVGAGSVVTKDVPDGSVFCGVPAKMICTVDEYAKKCLQQMPENFDCEQYAKDKKTYLLKMLK